MSAAGQPEPAFGRRRKLILVVAGTATLALALVVARVMQTPSAEPKPFTRESVSRELAARYPHASLPADVVPADVLAEEEVVFDASAAPALALDVYRPRAPGAHPLVILVHGGGWERGARTMERPFAKRLAALGFVAVPVSYRLGPSGRFPNALFDLKSAVRWLRAHATRFAIDKARVGAIGASAGGQLAALLGATNAVPRFEGTGPNREESSLVQAVVDIDGLADFTAPPLVDKERKAPGAPTRFLGGSFDARAAIWRDASALTHAGANSAPTLFINSSVVTPILPGRDAMVTKLRAAGVEAKLVVFPDTPHPFWLMNPWFEPTLREAQQFLSARLR